ncbi:Chitosanase precursor [Actinosynnema pretiosum subsp. pretiosum]|nr:Chitosanase precursor [Actinosynnema pretiosum subsp. pretiosum]
MEPVVSRVKPRLAAGAGLSAAAVVGAAFLVVQPATADGFTGPVVGLGGKCLDVAGASSANGTAVQLYTCNGTSAQSWTVDTGAKTIKALGKCLDVVDDGRHDGALLQIWDCANVPEQRWTVDQTGRVVGQGSGKCVDVPAGNTADGTRLQVWTCDAWSPYQRWTTPGGGGTNPTTTTTSQVPGRSDLATPAKKDIAMRLVSSAENSSLDWRAQFAYIEDIGDGRGYTAGIIGFCSGTGDMLELVEHYTSVKPNNALAGYLPALRRVNGTPSHEGLDPGFQQAWRTAAQDPVFQQAQETERDRVYFTPSVNQAKSDGLRALGQFAYYDAIVMHGGGTDQASFGTIRRKAMARAKTPAQGGDETAYLHAFLDERVVAMKLEEAHEDTSRVDTAQRVFLNNGNLDLNTPLAWKVYGDPFRID